MNSFHFVRKAVCMLGLAGSLILSRDVCAQDMPLSMLLIDGEDWQLVADNVQFSDGVCTDDKGNFYFTEMRSEPPAVWRVAADGKKTKIIEGTSCSGLRFGPDGRLYACVGKEKSLVAFELPSGKKTVIATNLTPNDLVVSSKGFVYITETGKHQVTSVNIKTGEVKVAGEGITAPNGITMSPDQGTLAASDVKGMNVWTFRVEADGSLSGKAPYMTMRTPVDPDAKSPDGRSPVYKTISGGDGMSMDEQGRYYVTTHLGLQVFDPTGRLCGVLPNPGVKNMTSVGFGGANRDYLVVACGEKVFKRKVQAKGALLYLPPTKPAAGKKK